MLACKRHVNDLKRSRDKEFRYRFVSAKASRVCKFIEALPHTKGEWAESSETIKLEPWQKFILCSLFGWVDKETGKYRFREAYVEVPRKNGKSILGAGIGLYKFAADGEFGAEVYSGATTEKQAWEVFRPAKQMAERTPALLKAFGITVNAKSLTIPGNGSRFEPVIGKPGDGSSPSCAIIDEYHEHASDDLVETMRTGMGARKNPLLFKITTAGSDQSSPCYAQHIDVQKLLDGTLVNERLFAIIYTIDDSDNWATEESARKANPNYGVSVEPEGLHDDQRSAAQVARLQNAYKTKREDVWVNADVQWITREAWDACCDPTIRIDDFSKQECDIGLDLASRLDIASKVKLFRRLIDGVIHYYAFGTHYLNESAVENARGGNYVGWAKESRLTVTPGNETDYNWIADDLLEDTNKFIVREVPHDPYHAAPLLQFVQARPEWPKNVVAVEVRQTVQNLSAPMKELEAVVLAKRFHHDGDPVLAWMIGNVVCHHDHKDNIYPNKQRPENKIDGVLALIMALSRAVTRPLNPSGYRASIFDRGTVVV